MKHYDIKQKKGRSKMTRIVHFAAAPLLYSKLFKLLYQVPEGIFMRRIPVSKGLGIGEETVIQRQKECRQIFRCNRANLCAHDTLTDGITAASVDVERFFHGSACFFAGSAQSQYGQLLDRAIRRTSGKMTFWQKRRVFATFP